MDNDQNMNTAPGVGERKAHHWFHFHCCWGQSLKTLFWVAAVVAFVLAWVAGDATAWGYSSQFWFVNTIALGILAAGNAKRPGSCSWGKGCNCGCGQCKDGTCKC